MRLEMKSSHDSEKERGGRKGKEHYNQFFFVMNHLVKDGLVINNTQTPQNTKSLSHETKKNR